jgi:hypothetical protein
MVLSYYLVNVPLTHQFLWFLNKVVSIFITVLVTGEYFNLCRKKLKHLNTADCRGVKTQCNLEYWSRFA